MLPTVYTVAFEDKVSDWSAMFAQQYECPSKLKLVACPKDTDVKVSSLRPPPGFHVSPAAPSSSAKPPCRD
jgi:hypothetical protein